MQSDNNLRLIFGAASVAVVSAALGGLAYFHRPLAPDGEAVLGGAQLVMFETEACTWCEKFRRKTAREYQNSEFAGKAPLKFMSVDDGPPPKRYRLTSFKSSPMLVLFDQYGREMDRIVSEPASSEMVETMVRRNLRKMAKS